MKYRNAVLLDGKAYTADGTEIIELKGVDPISRLVISYKCTNNGTTPTAHPAKCVTKIEVVDGSTVIFSASGIETQALEYWGQKRCPYNLISWYDNQVQTSIFSLDFGRYLWDKELAFDPAKYKNPQLKITIDLNGGGSAPDAGVLEVSADIFDQMAVSPIGYIEQKEHYSYSLVSSAIETIDLPRDLSLIGIIIMSLAAGKQPYEQYNKLKLSEDNDKRVPYNNNTSDLLKMINCMYPRIVEGHEGATTTSSVTHYCTPTYNDDFAMGSLNTTPDEVSVVKSFGGTYGIKAETGSLYFNGIASGFAPHGSFLLPCGDLMDMQSWLDAAAIQALKLMITAGSSVGSSSTCQILTRQLRRY